MRVKAARGLAVLVALGSLGAAGPAGAAGAATAAAGAACTVDAGVQTCAFDWTGGPQLWKVPPGVTTATVTAYGAYGGGQSPVLGRLGGAGGRETAVLSGLTQGRLLQVNVGGAGVDHTPGPLGWGPSAGGWNGGGTGASGGGGASDVRAADSAGQYPVQSRLVVAGGGGGNGRSTAADGTPTAGPGGGATGAPSQDAGHGTSGGTQTAGGGNAAGGMANLAVMGGTPDTCHDGRFGEGASCSFQSPYGVQVTAGGGGGGGWYGGGEGPLDPYGQVPDAGGGGSSHAGSQNGVTAVETGSATGGTFAAPAGAGGNGRVLVSYPLPNYNGANFTVQAGSWTLPSGLSTSVGSGGTAYILTMQGDGNLLVTSPGTTGALWATGTWNSPGAAARFAADGSLQVMAPDGTVVWRSATAGGAGSTLTFGGDGALRIADAAHAVRWFTSLTGEFHTLALAPGTALSVGSDHQLVMQLDGNLVWYGPGRHPLWASDTWGNDGKGYHFVLAPGGALTVRDAAETVVRSFGPASGGWWLEVQGDGNLVVVDTAHTPIWATGTSG
ncbi:hypothetical protein ACIQBJ_02170 [Kitasatospora sp. NPDC088391]|uniref:hypothetical protein n=1 Tax=Kitasatospora sp. NPDC088391 TaxID=3364074 RepID=UPI0037F8D1CD